MILLINDKDLDMKPDYLIELESRIKELLEGYLFEFNNVQVRKQIKEVVGNLIANDGIEYDIVCDETNNKAEYNLQMDITIKYEGKDYKNTITIYRTDKIGIS